MESGVINAGGIHPYFSQRLNEFPEGPLVKFQAKQFIDNNKNILSEAKAIPENIDYSKSKSPALDSCSQYSGWNGQAEIEYQDGLKIILRDEGRDKDNYCELKHLTLWRSDEKRGVIGIEPSLAALASSNEVTQSNTAPKPQILLEGEKSTYLASFDFKFSGGN